MKLLFRWIPRLILGLIIVFILVGVVAYLGNKATQPPDVKDAPWAIQTYSKDEYRIPSRVYYAEEINIIDGTPTITGYWSYDGERFKRQRGELSFPENEYGAIEITRRAQ